VPLVRKGRHFTGGDWNSACSNVTCPEHSCISLHSTHGVDLRWVSMLAYNFFVDQSLPRFSV